MRALSIVAALAAIAATTSPLLADESGLAGIHAWRQVGGRTCFVDHFHDGSGSGATQQAAMASAISSWQSFTSLEYGSDWASYANSISKSATCDKGTGTITCQLSSIPCKGGAMRGDTRKRRVK